MDVKRFKKITGLKVDLLKHTLDIILKHPTVKIYVGTDSQNYSGTTQYATVVAYRYGTKGVHYVYNKEAVPRITDIWTRLWGEAERSIEIAEWLKQNINVPIEIDLDFNEDKFAGSNKLISSTKGWAVGLGYKVNTKPEMLIAAKAADYHCR